MFENVQFFSHLHFKIAKSAIMTQKNLFLKNNTMGKAVNREDKLSRRYRDRDLAKFESSRRYRQR